ncbi:hypothetical protein CcCBS67573_g01485 [Chytriomyces confervae]|uniref:Uncharacterized protein n=1 Tax=Chytriomyces confervae TaxID=246404 RepID=A0A507FNV4_9FUNG|nr:hypothetical protein HDU80_003577 [Chytriomyces hyalinus]TPX77265.1 hypothetical protein CcCBS67573_g01485 [Chytriomyces confervae]
MIVAPKTKHTTGSASSPVDRRSLANSTSSSAPRTHHPTAGSNYASANQSKLAVPLSARSRQSSNSSTSSYSYGHGSTSASSALKSKLKKQAPEVSVSFKDNPAKGLHAHHGSSSSVSTQESQWSMQNNVSSPHSSRLSISHSSSSSSPTRQLTDSPTVAYFSTATEVAFNPSVSIPAGLSPAETLRYIPEAYLQDRNFYSELDGTRIHPSEFIPSTPLDDLIDDLLMPVVEDGYLDTNIYNPYDGTRVHPPAVPDFVKFAREFAAWDDACRRYPQGPRLNPFARSFVPGAVGASGAQSAATAMTFEDMDRQRGKSRARANSFGGSQRPQQDSRMYRGY